MQTYDSLHFDRRFDDNCKVVIDTIEISLSSSDKIFQKIIISHWKYGRDRKNRVEKYVGNKNRNAVIALSNDYLLDPTTNQKNNNDNHLKSVVKVINWTEKIY
jgi:hypothetical protein